MRGAHARGCGIDPARRGARGGGARQGQADAVVDAQRLGGCRSRGGRACKAEKARCRQISPHPKDSDHAVLSSVSVGT